MRQTLGVVISRMQVYELHQGHRHLIQHSLARHDHTLVFLGDREKVPGKINPLPGFIRTQMVEETFPTLVSVACLPDHPSNTWWSQNLDREIALRFPDYEVTLYCSRDGFKKSYSGRFPVVEIAPVASPSGSDLRFALLRALQVAKHGGQQAREMLNHDFRRGWMAAAISRPPIDFSTVDVAILKSDRTQVLLGQKPSDGDRWRFPGGFIDPTDRSRKMAAKREVREECGDIEIEITAHLGDYQIDDFRYRDEEDGVRTDLFLATYVFGAPRAGDDLAAVQWFPIEELTARLVDNHQKLGTAVLEHIKKES